MVKVKVGGTLARNLGLANASNLKGAGSNEAGGSGGNSRLIVRPSLTASSRRKSRTDTDFPV